ncbi:PREDICTED: dopamine N-acetyltransferase-like [Drosophila arizonae]|uniref:Dopamine N-acetyltransferase-like n=1 Tax=Drosophila arizonae TaxID=7263 RepID=A0ABM1NY77_DROAR|nr:PREDICTED: dopamine N-acetyltransferase-like [Drosophila arizonae]
MEPRVVNGIRIRSMTLDDYKEVKELLGRTFYLDEPLCMISGKNMQTHFEQEQDAYHLSMVEQNTCVVAVDESESNRIVGVVLAGAQVPSDLENHRLMADKYGKFYKFMSEIETEVNIFKRHGVSRVLYSHITAVERSMRGRGLGTRLTTAAMEVGRTMGFPLFVAYCTSFYSARQKQALGMQCIHAVAYADYKNERGEVVFEPPAPHTHVRYMMGIL